MVIWHKDFVALGDVPRRHTEQTHDVEAVGFVDPAKRRVCDTHAHGVVSSVAGVVCDLRHVPQVFGIAKATNNQLLVSVTRDHCGIIHTV